MKNYESFVGLSVRPDGDDIKLDVNIRLPQFKGKKLVPPQSHIFEGNDKTKIKYIFTEDVTTDTNYNRDTQYRYTDTVSLGKCSRPDDGTARTVGNCALWYQGQDDALMSRYRVTVEVAGSDGRKTVTYISEDADIDLVRIMEEPILEEENQA